MSDTTTFTSECPKCGHERPQPAQARDELLELIESGGDIEAYCGNCDLTWTISVEEIADLERALRRKPAK
ncbi:MAG TPA: hypothetical protein VLW26_12195 [Steroidobacteraceae bacterium]|nr:hypothetical protein [Steroidobacteraceae bacterium]